MNRIDKQIAEAGAAVDRVAPGLGSKGAHTPGPWRVGTIQGDPYRADIDIHADYEVDGNRTTRCTALAYGEANARLIAAAPEMLEALERIISSGVKLGEFDLAFTEAAIQKARGAE